MASIVVEVTHEDISEGQRNFLTRCPIALATKRALGGENVRVSPGAIVTRNISIEISKNIRRRISRYDRGCQMRPFKFTIDLSKAQAQ